MARGKQKLDAQRKKAEKDAKAARGGSQLKDQVKSLKFVCPSCKTPAPHAKTLQVHMDSKHPNAEYPSELKAFLAAKDSKSNGKKGKKGKK